MILFIWGCGDDGPTNTGPGPDPTEEASAEKQFVWNAMNHWYYWQGDVADLADSFDDDSTQFNQYLQNYSDAEALFEGLRYQDDRFSVFIDDYEEYLDERDGVFAAFGFDYNFFYETTQAAGDLVGYVRYVIPGSPADEAGLKRFDLFTQVDGSELTVRNATDLLTGNVARELTMAHIDTSNGGFSLPTDSIVTVASQQVIEDPVYHHEIIDTTGVSIGYLMYNAFQGNSHQRLNEVFGEFKSQNIDELVLDLRYNGGGAVLTSQVLSTLISGLGSNDEFARFTYNQKRSQRDRSMYFLDEVPLQNSEGDFETDPQGDFVNTEPINNLSLNTVYVLTSIGTASASEALINGLRPYVNVEVIGTQTTGKDVGSLLLTDSPVPYLNDSEANEDHKKAIQPIVLQFTNSDGETYPYEYTTEDGLTINAFNPTGEYNVPEVTLENLLNKPAIGSTDEPLLARAIAFITGQPAKRRALEAPSTVLQEVQLKNGIQDLQPHGHSMYIEPFMVPTQSDQ
jgi:C-terminal processing protease CtpA/Prc